MLTVDQFYLKSLLRHAQAQGILPPSTQAVHIEQRIKLTDQDKLWGEIENLAQSTFGVEFGSQLQSADLGTFGHLLSSAETIGQALSFLADFYPLIGEGGELQVNIEGEHCIITYKPRYSKAKNMRVEAVMAALISISKNLLTKPLTFSHLIFSFQPNQAVISRFNQLNINRVQTQGKHNALVLPARVLQIPLKHANPDIVNNLLPSIKERLAELQSISPFQLAIMMMEKNLTLSRQELAREMNLSPRSLCRIFEQNGSSFAESKRDLAFQRAQTRLAEDMSIESIAEELGYSDASAFIKAFKSWTGKTPMKFKQAAN